MRIKTRAKSPNIEPKIHIKTFAIFHKIDFVLEVGFWLLEGWLSVELGEEVDKNLDLILDRKFIKTHAYAS